MDLSLEGLSPTDLSPEETQSLLKEFLDLYPEPGPRNLGHLESGLDLENTYPDLFEPMEDLNLDFACKINPLATNYNLVTLHENPEYPENQESSEEHQNLDPANLENPEHLEYRETPEDLEVHNRPRS
jgi:hypothetical protein